MSVRVLFFGVIADQQKKRELMIDHRANMTLAEVLDAIGGNLADVCLIAVNQQQQADRQSAVDDGDEIAIMPPFSGG